MINEKQIKAKCKKHKVEKFCAKISPRISNQVIKKLKQLCKLVLQVEVFSGKFHQKVN
jgi:hypothetical protein